MDDYVKIWLLQWDMQAAKHVAMVMCVDELWYVMYGRIRARMFGNSGLDQEEPRRQAEEKWKKLDMPKGQLSWNLLDQLERAILLAREGLKRVGVFNDWNPDHLHKELRELKDKAKPEESAFIVASIRTSRSRSTRSRISWRGSPSRRLFIVPQGK